MSNKSAKRLSSNAPRSTDFFETKGNIWPEKKKKKKRKKDLLF
jgi:hypothetical protein